MSDGVDETSFRIGELEDDDSRVLIGENKTIHQLFHVTGYNQLERGQETSWGDGERVTMLVEQYFFCPFSS